MLTALAALPFAAQADQATDDVTLTPMWTAKSHPLEYPKAGLLTGPHFSGLIGATHGAGYPLFTVGKAPTPGIERLSEMGKHDPLDAEIKAAMMLRASRPASSSNRNREVGAIQPQ